MHLGARDERHHEIRLDRREREHHAVARHAGCAQPFAHIGFVAIHRGGIDVAVAELECLRDDCAAVAELRGAEADRRHLQAAFAGQYGYCCCRHVACFPEI